MIPFQLLQNCVFIDNRMSDACKIGLKRYYKTIELPCFEALDEPINAHPDLFLFPYHEGFLVEQSTSALLTKLCEKQMFFFADDIDSTHIVRFRGNSKDGVRYPQDCILNFAMCGNYIIGNRKVIHPRMAELILKYRWKFIHVEQAYAKCNVCTVADNALITEDEGIAKECMERELDVLLIKRGAVKLPGYAHGFIGGASSAPYPSSDGTKLFFCGCIEKHPEYEKIRRFCRKYDVMPVSLSNEPLTDYGSVLPLIRRVG